MLLLRFSRSLVTRYLAVETQSLVIDGVPLVSISNGPANLALSSGKISIDRYDADFTFYGPGITEIRYRTQQIHFLEDGGYLTPDPVSGAGVTRLVPAAIRATAYPNPFNPSTTIAFEITTGSRVEATVYDPLGRLVKRLTAAEFTAGGHTLRWDGTDEDGNRVASGVYFARLKSDAGHISVKLTVIK
jgi:hypothetical protein